MGVQKRQDEDHEPFEVVIDAASSTRRYHTDIEDTKLTAADQQELVTRFKALIKERTGKEFPQDPVEAALGRRRRRVRLLDERPRHRLSPQIQHPLRVGHGRQRAGDGLWQHRRHLRLRRRVHAQPGQRREGVLRRIPHQRPGRRRRRRRAHARTRRAARRSRCPRPIAELDNGSARPSRSTSRTCRTSSSRSRTASVFMLQTRNGKRTAIAALKFSMDMCKEKLIDWKTAILRNPADQLDQLLAPIFDRPRPRRPQGHRHRPARRSRRRLRQDLSQRRPRRRRRRQGREGSARPQRDLARRSARHDRRRRHPHRQGRRQSRTRRSSPARWARSASAAPARSRSITQAKTVTADGQTFKEGDFLSINGTPGNVYAGQLTTAPSEIVSGARRRRRSGAEDRDVQELPPADELVLEGHAAARSAPTPTRPSRRENAIAFGATGIGLTRTEHMFFEGDRIDAMREMILADNARRRGRPRSRSCCRTSGTTSSASSRR